MINGGFVIFVKVKINKRQKNKYSGNADANNTQGKKPILMLNSSNDWDFIWTNSYRWRYSNVLITSIQGCSWDIIISWDKTKQHWTDVMGYMTSHIPAFIFLSLPCNYILLCFHCILMREAHRTCLLSHYLFGFPCKWVLTEVATIGMLHPLWNIPIGN